MMSQEEIYNTNKTQLFNFRARKLLLRELPWFQPLCFSGVHMQFVKWLSKIRHCFQQTCLNKIAQKTLQQKSRWFIYEICYHTHRRPSSSSLSWPYRYDVGFFSPFLVPPVHLTPGFSLLLPRKLSWKSWNLIKIKAFQKKIWKVPIGLESFPPRFYRRFSVQNPGCKAITASQLRQAKYLRVHNKELECDNQPTPTSTHFIWVLFYLHLGTSRGVFFCKLM